MLSQSTPHPVNFMDDIPRDLAERAHAGTSFSPDRRGSQERTGYAETLAGDFAALAKYADTDEKRALLESEFARYREGYKARNIAYLGSRSRVMSTMITGPSNFPTRRNQKASDANRKRLEELVGFRERALAAITKKLRPELRPIMSGDADAIERLQEKIDKAESAQAQMKAANAVIRKHVKAGPDAQSRALVELGFTLQSAKRLLEPDFAKRIGFADYELTNNNANIRRMRARLEEISKAKTTEASEAEGANARVEDCPADNRIRLFFPGKPAEEVRAKLKAAGFRWSPTLGCWQAYRKEYTFMIARQVAGVEGAK